jgi:hypothetical protein
MLRALGYNFHSLTTEQASQINVPAYASGQNVRLGKAGVSEEWLTGDEVLTLIKLDNPDALGADANWLSGPAPLNYFYTFFASTLARPEMRGRVFIMVVNTEMDRGFNGLPPNAMGGAHWFVVAWIIDP